jgi:hypothetical protein
MKDVIGRNSRAFEKIGVGTLKLESSAFLIFFNFFEITALGIARESYVQFFENFLKKIHPNRSSERKVMPVLRRTLRIRFCWWLNRNRMRIGWGTNVKTMAAEKRNTTKLKHELNQQQRYELGHKLNTTDSETKLCKWLNTV